MAFHHFQRAFLLWVNPMKRRQAALQRMRTIKRPRSHLALSVLSMLAYPLAYGSESRRLGFAFVLRCNAPPPIDRPAHLNMGNNPLSCPP
jgi:hypothetical protein